MTGTLACMVMHREQSDLTWGIAGRCGRKLQKLADKFGSGKHFCGATRVETCEDLEKLARTARVVVDFTGPKFDIGAGMVAACISAGTHYIEVTGEPMWSKELQKFDQKAKDAGVCIVIAAGYASLPSDFAVWYLVKHLREEHGLPTRRVDAYSHTQGSTMSGTTLETFMKRDQRKYMAAIREGGGPFYLGGMRPGGLRDEDDDEGPSWQDLYTGGWTTTHSMMDNLNVRASCGLHDTFQPWGDQFLFKSWNLHAEPPPYHPPDKSPPPEKSDDRSIKNYENMVKRQQIQPPGSGPRERLRQETFVTLIFAAIAEEAGPKPRMAHCVLNAGPGGVGDRYEGSATLCLEAGACLLAAADAAANGSDVGGLRPGWGTPTYHLGHLDFLERIIARGFRFKVNEGPPTRDFIVNVLMSTMPIGAE